MLEQYTVRGRKVIVLAQEEARRLNHNSVGTEHILLGLIREDEGVAAKALESLGISVDAALRQVEEIVPRGQQAPPGHIPFTSGTKKVLELSLHETQQLGCTYTGTEHILLGLIADGPNIAVQVLANLGADLDRVREQVIQRLDGYQGTDPEDGETAVPDTTRACSFCGKSQERVRKLIAGPGIFICDECVILYHEILDDEGIIVIPQAETDAASDPVRATPRQIFEELRTHVLGQPDTLRRVAVSVFRHYRKTRLPGTGPYAANKDNLLLIGPTGCGKTLIARTLSSFLKVPIAIVDATTLTEAGFVGDDVDSIFRILLREANGDQALAEKGIVFLDEIDKKARGALDHASGREPGSAGVQHDLLAMLGGAPVEAALQAGQKNPQSERTRFETRNVLFIGGGTFDGLQQIIGTRLSALPGTPAPDTRCTQDDLEKFGFMPEFAGRFTTIAEMRQLGAEDYERIISDSPDSFFRECQDLFGQFGVDLEIEKEALSIIAESAQTEHAGVRGLRRAIETILMDVLFVLPDSPSLARCVITPDAARLASQPRMIDRSGFEIANHRGKIVVGYSRVNSYALGELQTLLAPVTPSGTCDVRFDGEARISPEWKDEITAALDGASLAVLLVSADLLSPDFVLAEGLPFFLTTADEKGVGVQWILLDSCSYSSTPLAQRQAAHDISLPLDSMTADERRAAWARISRRIEAAVTERHVFDPMLGN
jgi:ATP-dependent Clp protease ATP-binding subunit ClpX